MLGVTGFESFFIDKLIEYLALMNKSFEVRPEGIIVREKINGREIKVSIVVTEKWIRIYTRLGTLFDFPQDLREELLKRLLRTSWDYPEVTFCIDSEGNIYAVQDEYVHAFYYDVFEQEYGAIIVSIRLFEEIKEAMLKPAGAKINSREDSQLE